MAKAEWSTAERLALLRRLIEMQGFEVLDGAFVRRDGERSPYFLKPVDPVRLIDRAMSAFASVRIVRLPPPDDEVANAR